MVPNKKNASYYWQGMWDLNPRGLSTTDLAGQPSKGYAKCYHYNIRLK